MDEIYPQSSDNQDNIITRCFHKFINFISKRPLIIAIIIGVIAIFLLLITIIPANVCNSNLCRILTWISLISAIICIFIAVIIAIYTGIGLHIKRNKSTIGPDYMMTPQTDVKFEITGSEDELPDLNDKEK